MASVPVYCLCRLPYDVTRFMIECDICQDWFHGRWVTFGKLFVLIVLVLSVRSYTRTTYVWKFQQCFLSSSCVGVEEEKATEIDLYHCPNCQVTHGPSVSKLFT